MRREIVKRIDMWGIDMVFVVGGNGGNAGANAINAMCQQHDVPCAVVGVPKSIDNDILLIDKVGTGPGWGGEAAGPCHCHAMPRHATYGAINAEKQAGTGLLVPITSPPHLGKRTPHPTPAPTPTPSPSAPTTQQQCFGFDTAVDESQRALLAAKVGAAVAVGQ